MRKYVRVMDGTKSNVGGFEYKLDEINYSDNWNPNEIEPDKMGGWIVIVQFFGGCKYKMLWYNLIKLGRIQYN